MTDDELTIFDRDVPLVVGADGDEEPPYHEVYFGNEGEGIRVRIIETSVGWMGRAVLDVRPDNRTLAVAEGEVLQGVLDDLAEQLRSLYRKLGVTLFPPIREEDRA